MSECEFSNSGEGCYVTNLFSYSPIHLFTYKKCAFTLAEVLITLGIIGVVTALTISNLITKYQKHVTVVRLKEAYTILNQAVRLSERDNGDITIWDYEGYYTSSQRKEFAKKYFQPYLKLTEIDAYKLRLNNWKILDGTVDNSGGCAYCSPHFAMNNGMNIAFFPNFYPDLKNQAKIGVWIFVDINGAKGPGRIGRDVFVMSIYPYRYPNEKVVLGAHEQCGDGRIHNSGLTRDQILTHTALCAGCNKEYTGLGYACSKLIQLDDWQIKDDYPW